MRKLLLGSALAFAFVAPASADVILDPKLSGTGDNVVFNSLTGNLAIGSFNGMNQGFVDFTDLSGNALFTASQNGNDIKIQNTNDLQVQVFSTTFSVLPTATDVFSLKGSGDVTAFVTANEPGGGTKLFTFDLGPLSASAQSGFTLSAIDGESISKFILLDSVGGNITDFEHYRIDVASPVPGPIVGAGLPGLLAGLFGMVGLNRRRRKRSSLAA